MESTPSRRSAETWEKKKIIKITSPNDTAMLAKTHTVFNLISKKYDLAHRNLGPIPEKWETCGGILFFFPLSFFTFIDWSSSYIALFLRYPFGWGSCIKSAGLCAFSFWSPWAVVFFFRELQELARKHLSGIIMNPHKRKAAAIEWMNETLQSVAHVQQRWVSSSHWSSLCAFLHVLQMAFIIIISVLYK